MKTYLVEVFDNCDQDGGGMPCVQFEAQTMVEAYEVTLESLGVLMTMTEVL